MAEQVMITTRFGGSWEQSLSGCDVYVKGEVMPFCVDQDIKYEQFMEFYMLHMRLIQ